MVCQIVVHQAIHSFNEFKVKQWQQELLRRNAWKCFKQFHVRHAIHGLYIYTVSKMDRHPIEIRHDCVNRSAVTSFKRAVMPHCPESAIGAAYRSLIRPIRFALHTVQLNIATMEVHTQSQPPNHSRISRAQAKCVWKKCWMILLKKR
jgi:hypothetical protein